MVVELLIFKEIKLWQTIITQSKVVRVKDSTDNHEIIEIYHKQAKAKKLSGDTQGAIDDYIKIIKLKPDDVVAYNNIGNIYFSKDYYFHAHLMYDIALEINPEFEVATKNRKKCSERTRIEHPLGSIYHDKAENAFKDIVLLTEAYSILDIFVKYKGSPKNDDPFDTLSIIIDRFTYYLFLEVERLYRENDFDKINQYLDLILKYNPRDYRANCLKIRLDYKYIGVEQAINKLDNLQDDTFSDFFSQITSNELKGDIYFEEKDYQKAYNIYKKASSEPFSKEIFFEKMGLCSYYLKDYECTIKNFAKAEYSFSTLNHNKEYLNKIFDQFRVNNKFPKYLNNIDLRTLALHLSTENLEYVVLQFNQSGTPEVAIEIITKVLRDDKNHEDYHYYLRGKLLYENNDLESALEDFDNAIDINEDNAEYFYYRALTLNALDDFDNAKEDLLYAISLSNDNEKYQTTLDSMIKQNEFLNLATCSKERFAKFTGLNEEKVNKFMERRNNGKKYYDFATFSRDLELMPHEIVTLENRIIFHAKPQNKIGRKIDW